MTPEALIDKCSSCGKDARIAPNAYVDGIAVYDEETGDYAVRGVDGYGVSQREMTWTAADLAGMTTVGDPAAALVIVSDLGDPAGALEDAAQAWDAAQAAERTAAAAAYALIVWAHGEGMSESEISRRLRVDRMTVRRALGKR